MAFMSRLLTIFGLLAIAFGEAQKEAVPAPEESKNLHVLNDANFNAFIDSKSAAFVKFYAPWYSKH